MNGSGSGQNFGRVGYALYCTKTQFPGFGTRLPPKKRSTCPHFQKRRVMCWTENIGRDALRFARGDKKERTGQARPSEIPPAMKDS